MPAEFENGRITNLAVLLTETKFCRQNFQILPASCKREAKTALFYAVFKFYRHRVNGVSISTIDFTLTIFIGESTPLSINTLVQLSNHSLKRICYHISRKSRLKGQEIFGGPKDVSYLVDDPPGKAASKISHDQLDLERSDSKFFSRNDSTISKMC